MTWITKCLYEKVTMEDIGFALILIIICSSTVAGKSYHYMFAINVEFDGLS